MNVRREAEKHLTDVNGEASSRPSSQLAPLGATLQPRLHDQYVHDSPVDTTRDHAHTSAVRAPARDARRGGARGGDSV